MLSKQTTQQSHENCTRVQNRNGVKDRRQNALVSTVDNISRFPRSFQTRALASLAHLPLSTTTRRTLHHSPAVRGSNGKDCSKLRQPHNAARTNSDRDHDVASSNGDTPIPDRVFSDTSFPKKVSGRPSGETKKESKHPTMTSHQPCHTRSLWFYSTFSI